MSSRQLTSRLINEVQQQLQGFAPKRPHTDREQLSALANQPGLMQQLKAVQGEAAWEGVADEFIRWASPATHFRRTATEDFEYHGKFLRRPSPIAWPEAQTTPDSLLTIDDRLGLTIGARGDAISYYYKSFIRPKTDASRTFSQVTPKLGASWKLSPTHQVYANVGGGVEAPAAWAASCESLRSFSIRAEAKPGLYSLLAGEVGTGPGTGQ